MGSWRLLAHSCSERSGHGRTSEERLKRGISVSPRSVQRRPLRVLGCIRWAPHEGPWPPAVGRTPPGAKAGVKRLARASGTYPDLAVRFASRLPNAKHGCGFGQDTTDL